MQIKSWKHLSKANSAQVCNDMILTRRGLLDIMWRGINMHLLTHNHPFPLEMPCHRFKFLVYELLLPALKFYLLFPNQRTKEPKKNQPKNQRTKKNQPKNQPPFSTGNAPVIAPSLLLSSTCPLLMLLMRPRCTFQNLSKQSRQAGSWRVQVWWKNHPFLTCVNFREFKLLSPGPPRPSRGMQRSSPHKVES